MPRMHRASWMGGLVLAAACGDEASSPVSSTASERAQSVAREVCTSDCERLGLGFAFGGDVSLCVAETAFLLDAALDCPTATAESRRLAERCLLDSAQLCSTTPPASCEEARLASDAAGCAPVGCETLSGSSSDDRASECDLEVDCTFGFGFTARCTFDGNRGECTCESDGESVTAPITTDVCDRRNPRMFVQAACGLY